MTIPNPKSKYLIEQLSAQWLQGIVEFNIYLKVKIITQTIKAELLCDNPKSKIQKPGWADSSSVITEHWTKRKKLSNNPDIAVYDAGSTV